MPPSKREPASSVRIGGHQVHLGLGYWIVDEVAVIDEVWMFIQKEGQSYGAGYLFLSLESLAS